MGRRRAVEGRVLDLTTVAEGEEFVLEEHIVEADAIPAKTRIQRKARKAKRSNSYTRFEFTEDWMRDAYSRPCEFCGKAGVHYDHVNMFDKTDGVMAMIRRGCPRAEVEAEIEKCQFLCRACHTKVTRIEQKHGFMGEKMRLNRQIRANHDVSDLCEQLRQKYAEFMAPIYAAMRGGGPQGK